MLPTEKEMRAALVKRQGAELTEKFAKSVVAVCGLGGLGSNAAYLLARAGVGKLILIDFDRVDITNLHRQQYKAKQIKMQKANALAENIKEISPYTEITAHSVKITERNAEELLFGADIIIEAFDKAEEKAKLVSVVLSSLPGKYMIAASGMAGLAGANDIRTKKAFSRLYICGDGTSDAESEPLFSTRAALCAAHMAHMALRLIAGKKTP